VLDQREVDTAGPRDQDSRVEPLTYARAQMGLSLAFHILFAAVGVALPALMVLAEWRWRRTRDQDYLNLAKRLSKGTSIVFAVGAVSGTVLSFELGLLWPGFMGRFGEAVGLPFALEGFAFFTEAIFLGIYLYGRGLVSERMHLAAAVIVALSGAASAFFVTLVNAFMNGPAGVSTGPDGALAFDAAAAMFSASWPTQTTHVLLSCYQATAFAMAGIHAAMLLRRQGGARELHRKALGIALPVACVTALLQPLVGDRSAKHLAVAQPLKLAAAEAHFTSESRAPLHVGGWPDLDQRRIRGAIPIPGALSFMAHGDTDAVVVGLDAFPRDQWPPVVATRTAFQVMVGAGTAMAALALVAAALALRRPALLLSRPFLMAVVAAGPLGFVAMEAGWLVTEWGRQPWVVRGLLRTAEAVTDFPYKQAPFWVFTVVYLFLGVVVTVLLARQVLASGSSPEAPDAH